MKQFATRTLLQQFAVRYSYPVLFTAGAFRDDNSALRDVIAAAGLHGRTLLVLDTGVLRALPHLPETIERYLGGIAGLCLVRGGERCKNDRIDVDRVRDAVAALGLCRHSLVLIVGGGAVLDAAGYAAATAHRGIPVIRMPTTTLAQNDSGVGVKNGVNGSGRKNFIGTFSPPRAVVNDFDFLTSLPDRDKRAGIAEAVKVALIKDRGFFEFLWRERRRLASFDPETLQSMIVLCAELHCAHIRSGDPFESGSSRPLDFGHWSAHALEELTRGGLRHGEAVAIGIALDTLYSCRKGFIPETHQEQVLTLLTDLGFRLYHPSLNDLDIAGALNAFQQHLGGALTIPLISGIGSGIEVHRLDAAACRECIHTLATTKGAFDDGNSLPLDGHGDTGHLFSGEPGTYT